MQWKIFVKLLKWRDVMVVLGCTAALLLLCVAGLGKVALAYSEANEIKMQVAEMESFVSDWKAQKRAVEKAKERPVAAVDSDLVQTEILNLLTANEQQLVSLKAVQGDVKKADGLVYELVCRGQYEQTGDLMENFRVPGVLVGVQQLKLAPSGNLVEMKLNYKVYVK